MSPLSAMMSVCGALGVKSILACCALNTSTSSRKGDLNLVEYLLSDFSILDLKVMRLAPEIVRSFVSLGGYRVEIAEPDSTDTVALRGARPGGRRSGVPEASSRLSANGPRYR